MSIESTPRRLLSFNKNKLGIVVGLLVLALGISPTISSLANDQPTAGNINAGGGAMTSSVAVPPWCGWSQTPASSSIILDGAAGTQYTGQEDYPLTANSGPIYAYVNDGSVISSAASADNCSWFGMAHLGASLEMSVATQSFTSSSVGRADDGFTWNLSDKPLTFNNNFTTCSDFNPNLSASLSATGSVPVWSMSSSDVSTNNFCEYDVDYSTSIPSGLNPKYGGSTYDITGPTLTVTLTTS